MEKRTQQKEVNNAVSANLVYPWIFDGVAKFRLTDPTLADWAAYREKTKAVLATEIGPILKELTTFGNSIHYLSIDSREALQEINKRLDETFLRLQSEGVIPKELI